MNLRRRTLLFFGRLILAEELFVFIWCWGRHRQRLSPAAMKLWAELLYGSQYGWGEVDHW